MSIQKDLDELAMINLEIQRLHTTLTAFRKQKHAIETRVISFLKEQETPGVRYNDQAVMLETKPKRNKKRKTEKLNDLAGVLRKHGIQNSENLLNDILEAQRGQPERNEVLKMIRR